jgi:hypothetical protein
MTVKIDGIEPNIFPEIEHLDARDAGRNAEVIFGEHSSIIDSVRAVQGTRSFSKAQSCVEQQLNAGRNYADNLSHAKDFRELMRIQTEAWQSGLL